MLKRKHEFFAAVATIEFRAAHGWRMNHGADPSKLLGGKRTIQL